MNTQEFVQKIDQIYQQNKYSNCEVKLNKIVNFAKDCCKNHPKEISVIISDLSNFDNLKINLLQSDLNYEFMQDLLYNMQKVLKK